MSELMHVGRSKLDGAPIGSGRYPLGSGDEPYQRGVPFNAIVTQKLNSGKTMKEVADEYGISINRLRAKMTIAKNEDIAKRTQYAVYLRDHKQYGPTKIGEIMGEGEGTIRSLLKNYDQRKENILQNVTNTLKDKIDETGCYLDIGAGSQHDLGITRTKLNAAVEILEEQGYVRIPVQTPNMGLREDQKTTITVLCPPGTKYGDVKNNMLNIKPIDERFIDNGAALAQPLHYPEELSSKRVLVKYAEEGGTTRDGLIEIRRGAKDVDLGEKSYAQVRINVDGTHYIKGMAVYAVDTSDWPKDKDVLVWSNKKKGTPLMLPKDVVDNDPKAKQVLKNMENINDPTNPFGATIKPGGQHGVINICKEEGEWNDQRDRLASQFLSKQAPELAKKQLDLAYANSRAEFDTLKEYTNPTVRKKLLESFADSCDAAAVELHAAPLPRQSWKVLLPLPSLKDNEIYAPTYREGERVVLVRYPHGGTFELPELTVRNSNPKIKAALGNLTDAVAISPKAAAQLSGADFDGDTAIVIPTRNVKIRTHSPLGELVDFDAKALYPAYEGMPKMTEKQKQNQMGRVSNLITDMYIKGVRDENELARAVKHSMVVIDAKKHNLDYKRSFEENRIQELMDKYQAKDDPNKKGGGASTLISKASAEIEVPYRKKKYKPDPETGEWQYINVGDPVKNPKTGEIKPMEAPVRWNKKKNRATGEEEWVSTPKTLKSTRMAEARTPEDVRKLSSGTRMEEIYADYAIKMKAMANEARKIAVNTEGIKKNATAEKAYKEEVESLNAKLMKAEKHAPRERQAKIIANSIYMAQLAANPEWKDKQDKKKKLRGQALREARARMGGPKEKIDITPKEWEAIQAGAITNNKLMAILNNAKDEQVKHYASPKASKAMSSSKIAKMKAMANSGHTLREIADEMGISPSTVSKYI